MNEINFDEDQKNVFHQMTFFHSNENNIEYEFLNEKTTNIIDENNDHLRLIANDHEYYNELSNLAISEIMEDIWQKNITGLNFTLYQEKQTSHHIQSDVLLKKFQVFSILIKNRQGRQLAILIKIIFLMYFEMF